MIITSSSAMNENLFHKKFCQFLMFVRCLYRIFQQKHSRVRWFQIQASFTCVKCCNHISFSNRIACVFVPAGNPAVWWKPFFELLFSLPNSWSFYFWEQSKKASQIDQAFFNSLAVYAASGWQFKGQGDFSELKICIRKTIWGDIPGQQVRNS